MSKQNLFDLRLLKGKTIIDVRLCVIDVEKSGKNLVEAYEISCSNGEVLYFACHGSNEEQYAYIGSSRDFLDCSGQLKPEHSFAKEWHR